MWSAGTAINEAIRETNAGPKVAEWRGKVQEADDNSIRNKEAESELTKQREQTLARISKT
jgi:hypothetical protein